MALPHPLKKGPGFLAIDIDGTTLVEKIDKNPLYGLLNSKSHIRNALIEYIKAAQAQGYEIIIMTARPEFVEGPLGTIAVGTKATQDIIDYLKEAHAIEIAEIVRAPAGLKGKAMVNVLNQYEAGATGMLFDDQLKQTEDVRKHKTLLEQSATERGAPQKVNLFAFDINSKEDLMNYLEIVPLAGGKNNPFHPQNIVDYMVESNAALGNLRAKIETLNPEQHPKEIKLLNKLVDELSIRLYEAQYRNYKPEMLWVNKTVTQLELLVEKLQTNQAITTADINKASYHLLGGQLRRIKPNSNCDLLIESMLKECSKYPIINDLKAECYKFQQHLDTLPENSDVEQQKK